MKKWISVKLAGNLVLLFLLLLGFMHILILLKILPAGFVWGGQIENAEQNMLLLEFIALAMTAIFIIIIAGKTGYFDTSKARTLFNIATWLIFVYLVLNTVGNLASASRTETLIFTPITIIMALLVLRLAVEK